MDPPKISFGMIVLNGEPYLKYNIRSLYPHAHQIIIAEGACLGAKKVATLNGHSRDDTRRVLEEMQETEDPEKKIIVVTAEDEGYPNGFWPGEKLEQSQAYAKRATGNYLWQVDSDEFYKEEDIRKVKKLLAEDPAITAVSFFQLQFWGGFDYLVDSWFLRKGAGEYHRLFKWGEGYTYDSHRSPSVSNDEAKIMRLQHWIRGWRTAKLGIKLYHYSFVFPKQVFEKASYYQNAEWAGRKKSKWWAVHIYMNLEDPFSVFSVYDDISWLKRFKGNHPKQIVKMMEDINNGNLKIEIRGTDDIEALLKSPLYQLKIMFYKAVILPGKVIRILRKVFLKIFFTVFSKKGDDSKAHTS